MPALDGAAAASGRSVTFRAALSTAFATYATPRYAGEYQGLYSMLGLEHRWVRAELVVPALRIVNNGLTHYGVGDVLADVRVPFHRDAVRGLTLGAELAATLPTGSAEHQLGMGHAMAMPGVFAELERGALLFVLQAAYGRALTGSGGAHAHHGGAQPVVNPMNRSELEHAASASLRVAEGLRALVRIYGATPVANVTGVPREALAMGALSSFGAVDVSLELHLPLVGTPFSHKSTLGVAARF